MLTRSEAWLVVEGSEDDMELWWVVWRMLEIGDWMSLGGLLPIMVRYIAQF